MRNKRYAMEQVIHDPQVIIHDPEVPFPDWTEFFGREAPLHLEIGMGAGRHLAYTAMVQPDRNHVGIEEKYYRVHKAGRLSRAFGLDNTRFVCGDLYQMEQAFAPGSLDAITILFPDPWPRAKGERFRLTNPKLVEWYHRWLRPGGQIMFRTDHEWLFGYSVERFRRQGFALEIAVPIERVISNFEGRYLEEGRPIYGLVAQRAD